MTKPPTGCLPLYKNPGLTSFESLGVVKKALGTGKVCHTGTLDKFAEGLLLILTGRAVKLFPWFSGCDKSYRALLRFGEETDTLDPEGAVIAAAPLPRREAVEAALPLFTGDVMQAPPQYSAIHINGRRAHELARSGEEPEMKKRPVRVYGLSLLSWDPPHAELEVCCSSGTYIRSLARDIALAAGSRAHLRELVRTGVGNFSLDDAFRPPQLSNQQVYDEETLERIRGHLRPLEPELFDSLGIPSLEVDEQTRRIVSHGGPLPAFPGAAGDEAGSPLALFGPGNTFAALIIRREGGWKYGYVYCSVPNR